MIGWMIVLFCSALVVEGLFIGVDWTQYGIPSLIVIGQHIHHWMLGVLGLAAMAVYDWRAGL